MVKYDFIFRSCIFKQRPGFWCHDAEAESYLAYSFIFNEKQFNAMDL